MGIAVVGGMLFATMLTLFVVPAMYSYISSESIIRGGDENKASST
jgi:multidrug efflux pump